MGQQNAAAMPPRILPASAARCCQAPAPSQLSTFTLTACLASLSLQPSQQTRHASILSRLSNNKGSTQNRKRVGRGPSSGHGKTSGRGHKGQGQHGKVKPWFQGGQTPLIVQKGRKGFDNIRAPVMSEVNLDKLQDWINQGRIDPTQRITPKELIESNLVGSIKDGIKILARGGRNTLQQPIDIIASKASAGAIDAVERAGGTIMTRYYTKLSIRRLVNGESEHTDKPLPQGAQYVEEVLDDARQ